MSEAKPRLGLIGVGLMGHGIGRTLLAGGHRLTVVGHRNRAPIDDLVGQGATEAANPAEVAAAGDVLFLCVTGSPQVEALCRGAGGILEAARPGLTVVDCSTSEPASTLRLAAEFAARGATLVDAPLTRTPADAEAGRLNILVGGSEAVVARLTPILACFCENVFHAGPTGSGHKLKLISNFLIGGTVALYAEALVTAARAEVDGDTLYRLVRAGPLYSPLVDRLLPQALAGHFDGVRFQLGNALKDQRYYAHMAEEVGAVSVVGGAVKQMFTQASVQGFHDHFIASLIEAQALTHGVDLAEPG
ncbi:NAD(P)-dependent oxidoreductase [Siculibacillus lacustris]|uniref:NAD(P)-dependent oxidoreductase n=1 Tax=Siculibacillus lacustris TaxID=1549641 RepID=A0A4Q9VTN9_9HYPH|nr:NAD(P)-dependent oxidoreductase [Siculibacillus lacustris]TBW39459.1 NAD(P)-dependent oxidoreductase [Siculibacillus lacustris]